MRPFVVALALAASSAACQSAISAGRATVPNPNIAAFPAPPAGAVYLNNIQAMPSSAFISTGGTSCCGGTTNAGTLTNTFANASPSMTGSAVYLASSAAGYNVQTYVGNLGCSIFPTGLCTWPQHVQMDAYVMIPSSAAALQATEGPNVVIYTGSWQVYPSVQCGTNSGSTTPSVPTWNVWGNASGWISTNVSCAAFLLNTNTFQHIQWLVSTNLTASTPSMTYIKLFVNNTSINLPATSFAATSFSGGANIKPQYQVDGAGPSAMYVDAWNIATY